jgi:hypothetical protein
MTRREREQVVELLRCAADVRSIGAACARLGVFGGGVHDHAIDAWSDTVRSLQQSRGGLPGNTYADIALEAAARVEEGSYP